MLYDMYAHKKQINVCVSVHERQQCGIVGIHSAAQPGSILTLVTESRGYYKP